MLTLALDISKVRSVVGAKENYQLQVKNFDFQTTQFELADDFRLFLTIVNEGRYLQLSGQIETTVKSHCDRCLKEVILSVKCSISERLLFVNDAKLYAHLAVGELEELYYLYNGDFFDAEDLVRESILADLPLKVLCRRDCQGLCSKCGQDLNAGSCQCQTTEIDPRLAILAKLKATEEV